jgi:hypothetical protein
MATDTLKDDVLTAADDDGSLSERARLAVLAALEDPDALPEALGGADALAHLLATLTTADERVEEPVGAYLESIMVSGFRGIGPPVTVPLQPGPGLIVIAGQGS